MSAPAAAPEFDPSLHPTPEQRRGMHAAILCQCFGCLGYLTHANGLLLVYLTRLGQPSARVVFFLSIWPLISALFMLPAAYISDRHGKQLLGLIGGMLITCSFGLMMAVAAFEPATQPWIIAASMLLYGLGGAAFNATWFALLSPVVPEAMRPRFFGVLRMSWQVVGVVFTVICAMLLRGDVAIRTYVAVLAVATCGTAARCVVYWRIPELEKVKSTGRSFRESCALVMRTPGYMPFCAYVFLLTLSTASCTVIFGLLLKHVMRVDDGTVVWLMGVGMMLGQLLGFYLGGKAVDRWGTKSSFLVCHFGFALVLVLIVGRGLLPAGVQFAAVALLALTFGAIGAASSIAISTEMLVLIPPQDKSISTSMCVLLQQAGGSLSGLVFSAMLKLEMLNEQWSWLGVTFSRYETILLGCGLMVLLLVVVLGLVPSVMGKSQWMPRGL
jgi:MFS family permease